MNSTVLIAVVVFLILEAVNCIILPTAIGTILVIALSLLGIIANGFSFLLIKKYTDSNMKSVYFHLFSDMLAFVAVLLGGLMMYIFEFYWIDPLLTIFITIYLIYMGYHLLKTYTSILMLFTPQNIDIQ